MKRKSIKLFDPVFGKEEERILNQILKSKFWASGSGTGHVSKFENNFKKYVDSDVCVAVNSGTAALNLSLSLLDIKNKEVILPSMSFISTAHAVVINGGNPVFVDIDPKTLCVDPELLKKRITKKTRVVLPVHFAGMPCKLDKIMDFCKENNLRLIEDAAHAAGASFQNKKIGSHGFAVCFSFHPVKNLAMPTGGLISINHKNSKKLQQMLFSKRWCGITDRNNTDYDVKELGWNYYLNEFSAGIGLIQLKNLEKMNRVRRNIAKKYNKEINIEHKIPLSKNCSYHIYWVIVKDRMYFRKKLLEFGIETGIHYKPIHTMSMYKNNHNLPQTDNIGKHIVSIPIHPNLTESDIEKIIKYVNKFA